MVACSFIRTGSHGYVLRSYNNGTTWESIKFFDTPVDYYTPPSQYADTCYVPTRGCIALDNDGKIHVAFSVLMAKNAATDGTMTYFKSYEASFLTYWNEYMPPIDGAVEFVYHKIEPILDDYFDWNYWYGGDLYVKSTIPKMPVIGYFTPTQGDHYFQMDISPFPPSCYGLGDSFSFPQMTFDRDNTLHLSYLGLLDNGDDDNGNWMHHPFYTVTNGGGIWGQTKYLIIPPQTIHGKSP